MDWDNTIVNDDIDKMITDNIKNEEEGNILIILLEQKPEEKTKLGWAERAKARVEVAKVMTTAEEYFPELGLMIIYFYYNISVRVKLKLFKIAKYFKNNILGKEIDPEFLKA